MQWHKGDKHMGRYFKYLVEKYRPKIGLMTNYMKVSRNYPYTLYEQEEFKWDYLRLAGEYMGHDVSEDFPEMPIPRKQIVEESQAIYGKITLTECLRERNDLQRKLDDSRQQVISLQQQIIELTKKNGTKNGFHPV